MAQDHKACKLLYSPFEKFLISNQGEILNHKLGFERFGINRPITCNFEKTPTPRHLSVPSSSHGDRDNHKDANLDNIKYNQFDSLDHPISGGSGDDDDIEIFGDSIYDGDEIESISKLLEVVQSKDLLDNSSLISSFDDCASAVNRGL